MSNTLNNATLTGTTTISGTLVMPSTINGTLPTSNLTQRVLAAHPLSLNDLKVWNAPQTALPTTAAADDLGLIIGTYGTNCLLVQTTDLKAATGTLYARWPSEIVPHNYDTGQTIQLRFFAGMETTVSDGTATIDAEAYVSDGSGLVGSDQVGTAAQSINSLTYSNIDFDLGTALTPGDLLDIRIAIAITDAATGTAVIGSLGKAYFLLDAR